MELLPRDALSKLHYDKEEWGDYVSRFCKEFESLQNERAAAQAEVQDCTRDIEETSHFTGLDLDLDAIHDCAYIKFRFGRLPKDSYEKLNHYHDNPYVMFFPCTSDDIQYWGVYFTPVENAAEVDRIFSSLYFERVRLSELHSTPEHMVEDLQEKKKQAQEKIKSVDNRIEELWKKERKELQRCVFLPQPAVRLLLHPAVCRALQRQFHPHGMDSRKTRKRASVRSSISWKAWITRWKMQRTSWSTLPPVQLENKKPVRAFEFFVNMFGLPQYDRA